MMRTLRLLVTLLTMLMVAGCGGTEIPKFGTQLNSVPAPGFTLVDQRGDEVSLDDLQGKALALTFIYTNCPDICLLTAQNMRQAYEQVPENQRDRVALVAITVDPENDSPERLAQFTADQGLDSVPTWYALTGDRAALQPVWTAYGIDPGTMMLRSAQHKGNEEGVGLSSPDPDSTTQLLAHTDAVYVIDPQGQERAFGRSDADSKALADLLTYLAGS
jgi:protein SCO1/2